MPDLAPQPIPLEAIRAARARIVGSAIRTPQVRLNVDDAPAEIHLKLENLQPIGSFKLRGAANALALADPADLARGVAFHGRSRSEVPWETVTTIAQCRARLEESRRMRLASLDMWPDQPYLAP